MTWGGLALELGFAPLALWRRTRPYVWGAMLGARLGLIALIGFTEPSMGAVMLHLFTFDPGWVRPFEAGATEMIFYDGNCGLCHRAVRFVLAEDRTGKAFRFAPIDSAAFRAAIPEEVSRTLPNSVIIRDADGNLLSRSAGVIHIMRRLGGVWRLLAAVMALIPSGLRDAVYDFIARVRYRLFSAPEEACPLMPKHLRERFDY
jgi:predicted DCC family thiol-disulfide oxidoreductase YuxK